MVLQRPGPTAQQEDVGTGASDCGLLCHLVLFGGGTSFGMGRAAAGELVSRIKTQAWRKSGSRPTTLPRTMPTTIPALGVSLERVWRGGWGFGSRVSHTQNCRFHSV